MLEEYISLPKRVIFNKNNSNFQFKYSSIYYDIQSKGNMYQGILEGPITYKKGNSVFYIFREQGSIIPPADTLDFKFCSLEFEKCIKEVFSIINNRVLSLI